MVKEMKKQLFTNLLWDTESEGQVNNSKTWQWYLVNWTVWTQIDKIQNMNTMLSLCVLTGQGTIPWKTDLEKHWQAAVDILLAVAYQD